MREPPEEILDATCGGRSIWHPENKDRDDTLYVDKREKAEGFVNEGIDTDVNKEYSIEPDEVQDYRDLPYEDESFNLIVFDPPHTVRSGGMETLTGVQERKWGALHGEQWQSDLTDGFDELFRVLSPGGTLIFKFADRAVDFSDVLACSPRQPLFGTSVYDGTVETRWFVFYKPE